MTYLARDYIPVVQQQITPTKTESVLDLYSARYIKAFRNVSAFTIRTVTFREAGRLDLICNEFYDNRPDLLQPLARFNKILNPLTEVTVGRDILIPSLTVLEEALENSNTQEVTDNSYITLR